MFERSIYEFGIMLVLRGFKISTLTPRGTYKNIFFYTQMYEKPNSVEIILKQACIRIIIWFDLYFVIFEWKLYEYNHVSLSVFRSWN